MHYHDRQFVPRNGPRLPSRSRPKSLWYQVPPVGGAKNLHIMTGIVSKNRPLPLAGCCKLKQPRSWPRPIQSVEFVVLLLLVLLLLFWPRAVEINRVVSPGELHGPVHSTARVKSTARVNSTARLIPSPVNSTARAQINRVVSPGEFHGPVHSTARVNSTRSAPGCPKRWLFALRSVRYALVWCGFPQPPYHPQCGLIGKDF